MTELKIVHFNRLDVHPDIHIVLVLNLDVRLDIQPVKSHVPTIPKIILLGTALTWSNSGKEGQLKH